MNFHLGLACACLLTLANVRNTKSDTMDWTDYHPLEVIYEWFDYLEATFDFCEKEAIGQSYEGQDMIVLKVCRGGCGKKPAMWIDSGIHGNERIGPAAGTYMLNELVENDADHPELTQNLDWYFLPSHNPDGYRFSGNYDSGSRKTRSQYLGDECIGTDPNRNWDFHWGENGSINDSCSVQYRGPKPFSEVEVRNVRDFVSAHKDNIKFFQSIHSFGHLILLPPGYTKVLPPGYAIMLDLANRGKEALYAQHKRTYKVGCIPCVFPDWFVPGTSIDWAFGVAKIPYAYTLELGHNHFVPPDQIIPYGEETWTFHVVAAQQIISEFGKTCSSMCSSIEGCFLVRNTLMTTLTKMAMEFFISFEYKSTGYGASYQSVIHFTEDGDCCDVGKRIPGVWTHDGGRLHLSFSIDGNGNYYVDTEKYPVGQWHQAEFSQRLENGKYIYRVKINGKNAVEVENKEPRVFSNVKVYAANPWHNSLEGSIRNLFINKDAPNKCGG